MKIWVIQATWPDGEGDTVHLGLTRESAIREFLTEMVEMDDGENPDAINLTTDDWVDYWGISEFDISERDVL